MNQKQAKELVRSRLSDKRYEHTLNFPAPTEERRKQLAKEVSKLGEDAKVATRNIRREAMDKAKAMKKAGELTEDTQKTMEEDVQKLTDKYIKNIDAAVEEKQKEIMSV